MHVTKYCYLISQFAHELLMSLRMYIRTLIYLGTSRGETKLPKAILKEAFRFNNERYIAYKDISGETDLALPVPKKEFGKRRFSYNCVSHWNNLPYEAKSASFQTTLKQRIS